MSKKKPKKKSKPYTAPRDGRGVSLRLSTADHAALVKRAAASYRTVPAQVQYELSQAARPPAPAAPKAEGPEPEQT